MALQTAPHSFNSLYRDCCELARYIAKARQEIVEISPSQISTKQIPRAGQELDAIVKATESATNTIMEAAEQIMAAGSGSDVIDDACMRIFEACSFQDITGQRVTKVIKTLAYIEGRLSALQIAWGPDLGEPEAGLQGDDETGLLNGPQLEGEGISQNDVDRLLDESTAHAPAKESSQSDIDALFD